MDKELRYFSLPNILTLFNLIAGSFAMFIAFENPKENLIFASLFIFIAMFFDVLDGFVARKMNSVSKIGKNLDSLADLVSFGVAPAVIVFQFLKKALDVDIVTFDLPYTNILILVSPILIIVAAALRLAKFTADDRQQSIFLGLATPITAMFFASLPLVDLFIPDRLIILKGIYDAVPFDLVMITIGIQIFLFYSIWFFLISISILSILNLVGVPMMSLKGSKLGKGGLYLLIPVTIFIIILVFFKKVIYFIMEIGNFNMTTKERFTDFFNEMHIMQLIIWATVIFLILITVFYLIFEFLIPLVKYLLSKIISVKYTKDDFSWLKKNAVLFSFILISIFLFILLQSLAIPIIVILYILFSVGDDIVALFAKKK